MSRTSPGLLFALPLFTALSVLGALTTPAVFSAEAPAVPAQVSASTQGLNLEDFFTAAMDYSPRLQIAQDRWDIGASRKRFANGQLLPQLNANASASDNRRTSQGVLDTYTGERYSLQLRQVLFNWQAFSRRSQAYLLEDQYEAEYYAELAVLLTDVAEKYFDVLEAEDAVTSAESEINAVSNQLNQVERLHNLQLVQITDLYDTQARLAAVEAEHLDLVSNLELSRAALRAVTGLQPHQLFQLNDAIDIPLLDSPVEEWVQLARSANPAIIAQQFAVQITDKQISEKRGAYMPNVSLIVQQQSSNLGFENMPMAETRNTYLGVDVSIPLYAGGSNRAAVREAQSLQSIAENELRLAQLEISERARTAYLRVKSSETRVGAARKLAEAMELAATARQRGFELGTVTSVDVLNSIRDQYLAERDLQRVRYEHIKFGLILRREAGLLTAEDLLDVGTWLVPPGS